MELDELNGKCGQIARLFNLAIVRCQMRREERQAKTGRLPWQKLVWFRNFNSGLYKWKEGRSQRHHLSLQNPSQTEASYLYPVTSYHIEQHY